MILHWRDLSSYYGSEIDAHRSFFEQAGQTTYGLLCCRFAPGNERREPSRGDHAEQRLLGSALWTREIPAALESWTELNRSPILVSLLINRSPCPMCTAELASALQALERRFPKRFQHAHFVLASRGAYQGKINPQLGYYDEATTVGGLRRLSGAGWKLCVLQTGTELSPSGVQLQQALKRLSGQ